MVLTCRLESAGYELVERGDQTFLYRRRYFSPAALLLGLLLVVMVAYADAVAIQTGNRPIWLTLAGGLAGFASLALARRSETLAVTVRPQAGASTAMVVGHANGLARIVIQDWNPPWPPKLSPLPPPDSSPFERSRMAADQGSPTLEGA
jgi:hypothetical protein